MLSQLSLAQQRRVRIPLGLRYRGVLHCRHALSVQKADAVQYAGALLRRRRGRHQVQHHIHGRFLEDSGGGALCIPVDRAGLRVLRVLVDLRQAQRRCVGNSVVAGGMHQPHRIVRRHRVEIAGQQVASFRELALIPTVTLQPFAGPQFRKPRPHPAHGLRDRRHVAQVHVIELIDSGLRDVCMAVDEAGSRRPAVQIDAPRRRARQPQHLGIRADRDDLPAANRNCLADGIVRINGDDPSMDQHQLGRSRVPRQ